MKLKNFLKTVLALVVVTILVSTTTFAQTTYYVNDQTGLDGYNGLSPTTGGPGVGPKLTIDNAIAAASNGDIISIANTGVAYTDLTTGGKTLTFTTTGGTPVINSVTIGGNTSLSGPFALAGTGTLTLTAGAVTNANNITINSGGTISVAAGTLDVAPAFAGTANLAYTAGYTTGPEFPTAASVLNNLTISGGAVTLSASGQVNGTLNAGSNLILGNNILTLNNATGGGITHTNAGNITSNSGGGLVVDMTGAGSNVTFNPGVGTLPNLTVSGAGQTLTVNGPAAISGNVTVNSGSVALSTPTGAGGITGSLLNNGTGTVTVTLAMTIGGNVANNSTGVINFANVNITVNGNVTNNGTLNNTSNTAQIANSGNINFGNAVISISGTLTNSPSFSGTTSGSGANNGGFSNCGNITFASTTNNVTVTGLVTNSGTSSFTLTAGSPDASILSGNGEITFANTSGNLVFTGGVTNSSTGFTFAGTNPNGAIVATALTTGTLGSGSIANNSSNTGGSNGNIDFTAASTGNVTITGNVSLDNSAGTGKVIFGTGTTSVSGSVSNGRTAAGAAIAFSAAANNVSVGSLSQTGAGSITFASTTGNITDNAGVTLSSGTISALSTTGAITFTSDFNQTGGTFSAAALTTGTVSFQGNLSVSAGTLDLTASGASNVSVTNNLSLTGGALKLGAGARNFTVTGPSATINASIAFTGGANTTLVFNRGTSGQTLTSAAGVTWPGLLNINNTFPTTPTWTLAGGNFVVTGNVTFSAGGATNGVNVGNYTLFVGGNFVNNSGYTGGANGFVSMRGAGAQVVSGSANFYNIEVDNAAGATFGTGAGKNYTITGTFNLTNGAVATGAGDAVVFNNAVTPPTIVRNAGSFVGAPTFTTAVNVIYIGASKAFSNEIAAGELVNLTIATTGSSTVTSGEAFNFSGTLTINSGQTLAIGAFILTSNGSAIVSNGAWTSTTGYILLNKATGTAISATGALPEIRVAAGSAGNSITGSTGITVGTNPNLTLAAGTDGISLSFTGAGPHVTNITTASANNTITLNSNVIAAGNLVHGGGVIALGANNLTIQGNTNSVDQAGTFTGTGTLIINATGATTLSATSGAATIGTNFQMNMDLAGSALTVQTNNITFNGNVTLTKGTLTLTTNAIITNSLTLTTNSSVVGGGILDLAPATGNTVTANLAGNTSFTNITIDGNVNLAGTAGTITINNGALVHNSGVLNFGANNIDLTGNTTFNRTSTTATYLASTGWFQYNSSGNFTQGTGFSIPNLKVSSALSPLTAAAFVVQNNLYLDGVTLTHKIGGTARLTVGVAAGANPTITVSGAGNLDVAPAFATGQANYTFTNAAVTVNAGANYWPTGNTTVAQNVTVNMVGSATLAEIADSRTINGNLTLTVGTLQVDQSQTLTLASGTTITVSNNAGPLGGSISLIGSPKGVLSAANVNLLYNGTVAIGNTGAEYSSPVIINNIDAENAVTLNTARTISGTSTFNANVTVNAATTADGNVTVGTGTTLTLTDPLTVMGNLTFVGTANTGGAGTLTFGGAVAQTLTVPSAGTTVTNLTLNSTGLTAANALINVTGGNLTISNELFFDNGILNMGTNTLVLPNPTGAANSGLAFDRSGVTTGKFGNVVGNVSRAANSGDGASGTNGDFEFPVGNLNGDYRPVGIFFKPSYVVSNPTNIVVSNVDTAAGGTVGLPLNGGNGVTIGNYPKFYWLMSTTPSSFAPTQQFDLSLTGKNLGYPYASSDNLRIIRRQDGNASSNGWSMQGVAANYSNYQVVVGSDTTITARTTASLGGLVTAGSRFTIGIPSSAPTFTAPTTLAYSQGEGTTITVQYTATTDVGQTITGYAVAAGTPSWATINATTGLLTLAPPYGAGSVTPYNLTVTATSSNGLTSSLSISDTIKVVDRPPVFVKVLPDTTIKNDSTLTFGYTATDPDAGQTLTFSLVSVTPAPSVSPAITSAGVFTWTPAFADVNKTDTVIVKVSDGTLAVNDTAIVHVIFARKIGDVDGSGGPSANGASLVLQYVVGSITLTPEQLYAADVNKDGQVGALDAAWILYATVNGKYPDGSTPKSFAAGSVKFGELTSTENTNIVNIPIVLANSQGVMSSYIELNIDKQYADIESISANLPQGWIMSHNYANGVLKIAMAGVKSLSNGTIATVSLKLTDKNAQVNVDGLAKLNDNTSSSLSKVAVKIVPDQFALSQNYPNPFNPSTTIKYQLAKDTRVSLTIYDMLGQEVRTLVSSEQSAGYYNVVWDGRNANGYQVSSGVYIYRLQAGSFVQTLKMSLLK
ncbi:MAG: FlgD immunoglobulin-like domain containing protein [Ignavibacteriaceae bacterium]